MSTTPRLLFVRAAAEFSDGIVDHFRELCRDHGVELVLHEFEDLYRFESFVCCDEQFEYVFVAAHGNESEFGPETGTGQDWRTFADALCATGAVSSDSHVFLGCCKGGRLAVSEQMYQHCGLIGSICGPEPSVTLGQIIAGFEAYFAAIADGSELPMTATECAIEAASADFRCFELSVLGIVAECGDQVEVDIEFEESDWVEADADCQYGFKSGCQYVTDSECECLVDPACENMLDPECVELFDPECDEGLDSECAYVVGPGCEYRPGAEELCDDQSNLDCDPHIEDLWTFGEGNCYLDGRCVDLTQEECRQYAGQWCGG